jgi:hypothetical protein
MGQYSISNIVYFCMNHVNCGSSGECWEELSHKHSRVIVASTREILKLMDKVRCSASVLGKEPYKKHDVLTEENG